jgi:hypothetical protein
LVLTSSLLIAPIALADGMKHGDHDGGHKHKSEMLGGGAKKPMHGHGAIEIPKDQPIPTVKLEVKPDPMMGWNLQVQTANFTFAPENMGSSKTTEGHAHLFLNGKKMARLYGTWSHIPKLPVGKNEIRVTLNTNMHEDLTVGGQPIAALAIVEVPATQPASDKPSK